MAVMSDNIRTDSNEEIERLGLTAALKYYMDTYDKQKAANESLLAECRKLELQQRIHIATIRDLQCGALNYLTYPHDGERQGLDSAVKASLCIVPLEDDATAIVESGVL